MEYGETVYVAIEDGSNMPILGIFLTLEEAKLMCEDFDSWFYAEPIKFEWQDEVDEGTIDDSTASEDGELRYSCTRITLGNNWAKGSAAEKKKRIGPGIPL